MNDNSSEVSITVLLPAGRLPLDIMKATHELAEKYQFGIYFSLAQNMRLINVPESAIERVNKTLTALGADFKSPGKFPLPRICIGKPHCDLGLVDTEQLSQKILARFGERQNTKAKLKISIAGCTIGCPWPQNTDISITATRRGYTICAGGKGGMVPRVARRIKREATEPEVLDTIATLVDFHDRKTKTKRQLYQLLEDPEFPFPAV